MATKKGTKKKPGLKFTYCECGCKGYECNPGDGLNFWIYWDLKTSFYLHKGHGFSSPSLGTFTKMEKAVEAATKVAEAALKKLQTALA